MSKVYSNLERRVKYNKEADITSLPTRLQRLDQYTTGVQQGMYILVGAETGVGKTKFTRDQYLYYAYNYWLKNQEGFDIEFIDFSLEMTAEDNMADLITKDIYADHKKIVTRNMLLSQSRDENGLRKKLSEDNYKLFKSYEEKYSKFEEKLTVIDGSVSVKQFHDALFEVAKRNGKFEYPNAKSIEEAGKYIPNNPKKFIIFVFDTVNLGEGGDSIKATIDRISRLTVLFCNTCRFTGIIIQQFNADSSDTLRQRHGIQTPMLRDFEDSKRTTKDAHIVYGLFDPTRYAMDTLLGYDVKTLGDQFRSLHLLKNRFGEANRAVGLLFKGAVGMFAELPKADELNAKPALYKKLMEY